MQQRSEPADSLDYFPTPPWATRALLEKVLPHINWKEQEVWEPACGEGDMAKALKEYAYKVHSSDIHDYGYQDVLVDFTEDIKSHTFVADWVITNPPFNKATEFIEKCLYANQNCAMLCRLSFIESKGRYEKLFKNNPPTIVAPFVERVAMFKGRLDRKGGSATSYAWFVWEHGKQGTEVVWIPPCRNELERDEDWR